MQARRATPGSPCSRNPVCHPCSISFLTTLLPPPFLSPNRIPARTAPTTSGAPSTKTQSSQPPDEQALREWHARKDEDARQRRRARATAAEQAAAAAREAEQTAANDREQRKAEEARKRAEWITRKDEQLRARRERETKARKEREEAAAREAAERERLQARGKDKYEEWLAQDKVKRRQQMQEKVRRDMEERQAYEEAKRRNEEAFEKWYREARARPPTGQDPSLACRPPWVNILDDDNNGGAAKPAADAKGKKKKNKSKSAVGAAAKTKKKPSQAVGAPVRAKSKRVVQVRSSAARDPASARSRPPSLAGGKATKNGMKRTLDALHASTAGLPFGKSPVSSSRISDARAPRIGPEYAKTLPSPPLLFRDRCKCGTGCECVKQR